MNCIDTVYKQYIFKTYKVYQKNMDITMIKNDKWLKKLKKCKFVCKLEKLMVI